MAQVKVFLTTALPIVSTKVSFKVDGLAPGSSSRTLISAATAFSATGDAYGYGHVDLFDGLVFHLASPLAGLGRLPDVPLIELSIPVDIAHAISVSAQLYDLQGLSLGTLDGQSGGVNVGGTLSLANVTPGGGIVPGGTTLQVRGMGFTRNTVVTIEGVNVASTNFVSPISMEVTLGGRTEMTSKHIRLQNPDGEQVDYWSWLHDLPQASFPIFPLISTTAATASSTLEPSWFSSLSFQNPTPVPLTVAMSCESSAITIPAWATMTVPANCAGLGKVTISSSATVRIVSFQVQYQEVASRIFPVTYMDQPPPLMASLVNSASLRQGPIAPGEIITIFGNALGVANTGSASATSILFNGIPAPMLYASASQVNAVVPYEIAGSPTATVQVDYGGSTSTSWDVPVASAAPAIFTLDSSGQGQSAVLNQDNSINGPSAPAARGNIIQIFATGDGQQPSNSVKVTIGGIDAPVKFAGAAPDSVAGLFQVNAQIPQAVTPGQAVPISLTIGDVQSPNGTTVAVK